MAAAKLASDSPAAGENPVDGSVTQAGSPTKEPPAGDLVSCLHICCPHELSSRFALTNTEELASLTALFAQHRSPGLVAAGMEWCEFSGRLGCTDSCPAWVSLIKPDSDSKYIHIDKERIKLSLRCADARP